MIKINVKWEEKQKFVYYPFTRGGKRLLLIYLGEAYLSRRSENSLLSHCYGTGIDSTFHDRP